MNVMNRDDCIDIVNKLVEFNLISEWRASQIMSKRDKQDYKERKMGGCYDEEKQ